jgi:hypothetical protein
MNPRYLKEESWTLHRAVCSHTSRLSASAQAHSQGLPNMTQLQRSLVSPRPVPIGVHGYRYGTCRRQFHDCSEQQNGRLAAYVDRTRDLQIDGMKLLPQSDALPADLNPLGDVVEMVVGKSRGLLSAHPCFRQLPNPLPPFYPPTSNHHNSAISTPILFIFSTLLLN